MAGTTDPRLAVQVGHAEAIALTWCLSSASAAAIAKGEIELANELLALGKHLTESVQDRLIAEVELNEKALRRLSVISRSGDVMAGPVATALGRDTFKAIADFYLSRGEEDEEAKEAHLAFTLACSGPNQLPEFVRLTVDMLALRSPQFELFAGELTKSHN